MHDAIELLRLIWDHSEGDFVFLPFSKEKSWYETGAVPITDDLRIEDKVGCNQYFTPLRFTDHPRSNENVGRPGVLFADLDPVYPLSTAVTSLMRPSVAWETSPGMYQAVWFLSTPIAPEDFGRLNRALTHATGADTGGWPAAKVLRIPGTLNWKRGHTADSGHYIVPRGRVIDYNPGLLWEPETAYNRLEPYMNDNGSAAAPPDLPVPVIWEDTTYFDWWGDNEVDLPLRLRAWLQQRNVSDRSMMVWKAATAFAEVGVSAVAAFNVLHRASWNKFKDRPEQLWRDIGRAYAQSAR